MASLRVLLYAIAVGVGVVVFAALGLVLFVVAAAVVLVLGTVGAARFWLLRRRLEKRGILLFPTGSTRRAGGYDPRWDPNVIDAVPERD